MKTLIWCSPRRKRQVKIGEIAEYKSYGEIAE
jgi:hypothetical protein